MNRREMILRTGAVTFGLGLSGFSSWAKNEKPAKSKKVLFFSKSAGFEHSAIKTTDGKPSYAQSILTQLGPVYGIEFTFSKDGSLFTPEYLDQFDAYFFYTTGLLTEAGTDKNPPMTPEGKMAFLHAIENGKGFIGSHSATDTYHTGETSADWKQKGPNRYENDATPDPYIQMIGAEFIIHGKQQPSSLRVIDPKFPGFQNVKSPLTLTEEWYSLKDFAPDMHVLLLQQTKGMEGNPYERPPYPETWARMHGKGRVFYTSMGHRDDVWTNPSFQNILFGGISWAVGNVDADVTPNLKTVAPDCMKLPKVPPPADPKPKKAK